MNLRFLTKSEPRQRKFDVSINERISKVGDKKYPYIVFYLSKVFAEQENIDENLFISVSIRSRNELTLFIRQEPGIYNLPLTFTGSGYIARKKDKHFPQERFGKYWLKKKVSPMEYIIERK